MWLWVAIVAAIVVLLLVLMALFRHSAPQIGAIPLEIAVPLDRRSAHSDNGLGLAPPHARYDRLARRLRSQSA
jgi:hypothetical protein